jgi:transcriptional regulator with XRE-family HTH domain
MGGPSAPAEDFTALRERCRPDETLTALAARSGVSRRTLVYYEWGNIERPHSPTTQALARALGVDEADVAASIGESYRKRQRRSAKRSARKARAPVAIAAKSQRG